MLEASRRWRKMHNEVVHNSYFTSYTISVIKPRWTGWAEIVTRMAEMGNAYRVSTTPPKGSRRLRGRYSKVQ
jgi:hypothetical protein